MPRNTIPTASEIKFGVEIECYLPVGIDLPVGSYHHGLQVTWAPDGWNAQSDASLYPPSGYRAAEIVSPVLAGEAGLEQVLLVADTLKTLGACVNDACGLHVHVDASHLQPTDIRNIVAAFKVYEAAFFAACGTHVTERSSGGWCKPTKFWSFDPTVSDRRPDHSDRYQSLNTTNFYFETLRKRTIEIRVFPGTVDAGDIITAVYMAVALVAKALRSSNDVPAVACDSSYRDGSQVFIATHLHDPRNLIIPDEFPVGIANILLEHAQQAEQAVRN